MEKKKRFKHPSREEQTTDLSLLREMNEELGIKEVDPPKDAGAIVIFPGPDGKVDMIDAVERLYGIKHDKGDRVIRIRGGEIVSDEVVD